MGLLCTGYQSGCHSVRVETHNPVIWQRGVCVRIAQMHYVDTPANGGVGDGLQSSVVG